MMTKGNAQALPKGAGEKGHTHFECEKPMIEEMSGTTMRLKDVYQGPR
jgi:hypothetical protein